MITAYKRAYTEVIEIIKYFPNEEYAKIPLEKINYYKENMDKDYNFKINPNIELEKQNISREANAILVTLFNDYFATDRQKEILKGKYNTSVNMLINASIEELIKTENINLYAKEDKYSTMKRSLLIKESFSNGLNKLKEKYNISISKLINMAIKNAVNS